MQSQVMHATTALFLSLALYLTGCALSHRAADTSSNDSASPARVVPVVPDEADGGPTSDFDANASGSTAVPSGVSEERGLIATVPLPLRRDMVFSSTTGTLYITTSAPPSSDKPGAVERWQLASRALLMPLLTDGQFRGIDISPDEQTLAIADAVHTKEHSWLHIVDLKSGAARRIQYPIAPVEGGSFCPVFLDDHTVLVSGSFEGTGWVALRRIDLRDDSVTALEEIGQSAMLSLSADRTTLSYVGTNTSDGPLTRVDLTTGQKVSTTTGWFLYEVATSRDGSFIAVPSAAGTFIFDRQLVFQGRIGQYGGEYPVGAVFSPVRDELYLSWLTLTRKNALDVYDPVAINQSRVLDTRERLFGSVGNHAFAQGRIRTSSDGRWIFAGVRDGVAVYAEP